ncbi:hypothetical protein [Euryhalocaulis caribicus]|uniref:hypothetical protein n=1 Tax=Euryhalocaulis caribicus TaxID=1161401 RepID=UPI0003A487E0|nr:hypothetical protein [Euryhalocaulis caribicus]
MGYRCLALAAPAFLFTAACAMGEPPQALNGAAEITYHAQETAAGVCEVVRTGRVNKAETGLYKIHGENFYRDVNSGESTNIPLQALFMGADVETGMSEDRATTSINSDTPCADLKIEQIILFCLYDADRREEAPCPDLVIKGGESFAEITVQRRDLEE